MTGFGGINFGVGWGRGSESLIADHHFPWLPVQFEEDSPVPVGMGFTYREIFEFAQGLAWLQVTVDFLRNASRKRIEEWAARSRLQSYDAAWRI